jgi:hypothetical protein
MTFLEQDQLRYELKYIIGKEDQHRLKTRLGRILHPDPHADSKGGYHVRSLYFDDLFNTAYREKTDGIHTRHKYRLRIYNCSNDMIRFEKKIKVGECVYKRSAQLNREQCDALLGNRIEFLYDSDDRLMRELYCGYRSKLLRPVVIVDYMREAYVHQWENVRITFDSDLRVSRASDDFFNHRLSTIPVLNGRSTILEIKFNRTLPSVIRNVFEGLETVRESVSKYLMCMDAQGINWGINGRIQC